MHTHQMLIGGRRVAAAGNETFESFNPYTGKPWALVPRATPDDVDRAVDAAGMAFRDPSWRGLTASQRGALLWRLGDLVAERAVSYMSPFGGYKRSGIGRESGLTAIREYLQTKSVWIDFSGKTANPFVMR